MVGQNGNNKAIFFLIGFVIVAIIGFIFAIINFCPENFDPDNMEFAINLRVISLVNGQVSSTIFIFSMLTVVLIMLSGLFVYSLVLNRVADNENHEMVVHKHRKLENEQLQILVAKKLSFIIAYVDSNDDLVSDAEYGQVYDLINRNYKLYVNRVKLPLSDSGVLYIVYINGKKVDEMINYRKLKPLTKEIAKIENDRYKTLKKEEQDKLMRTKREAIKKRKLDKKRRREEQLKRREAYKKAKKHGRIE